METARTMCLGGIGQNKTHPANMVYSVAMPVLQGRGLPLVGKKTVLGESVCRGSSGMWWILKGCQYYLDEYQIQRKLFECAKEVKGLVAPEEMMSWMIPIFWSIFEYRLQFWLQDKMLLLKVNSRYSYFLRCEVWSCNAVWFPPTPPQRIQWRLLFICLKQERGKHLR